MSNFEGVCYFIQKNLNWNFVAARGGNLKIFKNIFERRHLRTSPPWNFHILLNIHKVLQNKQKRKFFLELYFNFFNNFVPEHWKDIKHKNEEKITETCQKSRIRKKGIKLDTFMIFADILQSSPAHDENNIVKK